MINIKCYARIWKNVFTLIFLLNSVETVLWCTVFVDKWVTIKTKAQTEVLQYWFTVVIKPLAVSAGLAGKDDEEQFHHLERIYLALLYLAFYLYSCYGLSATVG